MANSDFQKATFNLPIEDFIALQKLTTSNHVTVTSLVRKAIETKLYLNKLETSGGKILIKDKNGDITQLVRRYING
jgi:hypothetical protein